MKQSGRVQLVLTLGLVAALWLASCTRSEASPPDRPDVTCLTAPYKKATTEDELRIRALVDWLEQALAPYRSFRATLEQSAPEICLVADIFGAEGYLGVEENKILLRRSLSDGMLRAVALHELRHAWQVQSDACPSQDLSMDEYARVTLALEADASAVSLAVAWDLKAKGSPLVWETLASWPTHVDLARAFATVMADSNDPARATARAFGQWFASDWRQTKYRRAACSDYLDLEDRTHVLRQYGEAEPDYLDGICRMPDGREYPCVEPEETP